jgi:hypothetical protein
MFCRKSFQPPAIGPHKDAGAFSEAPELAEVVRGAHRARPPSRTNTTHTFSAVRAAKPSRLESICIILRPLERIKRQASGYPHGRHLHWFVSI